MTTAQRTDRFFRYLQFEKRVSPNTLVSYQTDLSQFFYYLEHQYQIKTLPEITHFLIRSWIVKLMDEGIVAKSVNRKISALKTFFRFLMTEKAIVSNPMTKIISPKIPKRLPEFVPKENMENLFAQIDFGEGIQGMRDRLVLEILYGTGIRRAELAGLKDHSFSASKVQLRVLGKRNKERILPVTPVVARLIQSYIDEKNKLLKFVTNPGDFLILDNHFKPIKPAQIYSIVKKYLSAATSLRKKSPHVLRHTFATHLLNNGADINAVKELLGHASLAATQVYTHNTIDKLRKVYRQAHPKA